MNPPKQREAGKTAPKGSPPLFVRGLNWLGDAVISLPAVMEAMKGGDILLCARGAGLALYKAALPGNMEILEDKRGLRNRIALIKDLRARRLPRALLLQNAFGAALVAFLSGMKERTGYSRDLRSLLLTRKASTDERLLGAHEAFYYLNLLRAGGLSPEFSFPEIIPGDPGPIPEDASAGAPPGGGGGGEAPGSFGYFIKSLEDAPFVLAAAPGASYGGAKRAPVRLFQDVSELVLKERPGALVILGGDSEREAASGLELKARQRLGDRQRIINLAGSTTMGQAARILSIASLLLTNDSGLMHLGGAAGSRVLAFFGPTSPCTTGPLSPLGAIVRRPLPCSPCLKRECPLERRICFEGIDPRDAAGRALALFDKPRKDPGKRPGVILLDGGPGSSGAKDPGIPVHTLPEGGPPDQDSIRLLGEGEGLDLGSSVFIGGSEDALRLASAFGGAPVLWLNGKSPMKPPDDGFIPRIVAPDLEFALSYAKKLLEFQARQA
jgi:heptosyltransferase-2